MDASFAFEQTQRAIDQANACIAENQRVLEICLAPMSRLRLGMSLEGVRALLPDWKDHPRTVEQTPAHLYSTWDFAPPEGCKGPHLRITFDNDRVLIWGEAASVQTQDAIDHAAKAIRDNDEFLKRHSRQHPPRPAEPIA